VKKSATSEPGIKAIIEEAGSGEQNREGRRLKKTLLLFSTVSTGLL
jgi:hypothetical protein